MPFLSVEALETRFHTHAGAVPALDRVSPRLEAGEVPGVVGDSG